MYHVGPPCLYGLAQPPYGWCCNGYSPRGKRKALWWRYWDRSWVASATSGGGPVFEQDNVTDRFGFYHVLMTAGVWPGVLMSVVSSAWKAKSAVTRDVDDGLYSKTAYAVAKGVLDLVSSGGVFLAYVIPGYLLAGLHYPQQDEDLDIFYFYIGENLHFS